MNDRDYLLDRQLRELYGSRPGGFRYHFYLMELSGVGFMEQQTSVTSAVNSRISLWMKLGNMDIRHQKRGVLGAYPSSQQTAQAGMIYRHAMGSSELLGDIRDGLSQHAMAGLQGDWKLDNRTTLELALLIGAEAPESVALRVDGIKDEIRVSLLQGLTPRDVLGLRISGRNLRNQEYNKLGEGVSFDGDLNHRLLAGWPDTTVRVYGGYYYYGVTGTPTGKAGRLLPAPTGTRADASFFVPSSFAQAGAGIAVDQEGRSSYTRNWRSFGAADAGWNSSSGIGFHYELGLVGPLFGLDKLEAAFSQGAPAPGMGKGGAWSRLRAVNLPRHIHIKALLAVSSGGGHNTSRLLQLATSDNDDEIRLLAFNLSDRRKKVISASISESLAALRSAKGTAESAPLYRTLAFSYWEMIFNDLATQDLALFFSRQSLSYALRLLNGPQQWKQSRQAAITRVERFYTYHQMFDRYDDLYRAVLA